MKLKVGHNKNMSIDFEKNVWSIWPTAVELKNVNRSKMLQPTQVS